MRISLLFLALLLAHAAFADELTRAVQEQLRAQKLYSGPANGEKNEAFTTALKTYQQQHGLPATGLIDRATAKALDDENAQAVRDASASAAPVRPSPSPAPTGPPSDLRKPPTAPAPSTRPPASVLPAKTPEAKITPVSPAKTPEAKITPVPPATTPTPSVESSAAAPSTPTASPVSAVSPQPPAQDSPQLAPQFSVARVTKFLRDFLHAGESKSVTPQLRYFSFPVDYFEHGAVNEQFVRSDTLRYMRRWPRRRYTLLAPVTLAPVDADTVAADFTISYTVQSGKRRATGHSSNRVTLREVGGKLKIVGIQER